GGDVAARCLILGGDGNAVAIVLDIEQHRQVLRGRNRESRPETAGRHGGITTEGYGNAAVISRVAESLTAESDRLRPARGGSGRSPHTATGWQYRRASTSRHVEHNADVAAVAERTGSRERSGRCVFEIESQGQHERP